MIARKEINWNTRIDQFGNFSLDPNETFRNCMLVFKPKIEDVSNQVNFKSVFLDVIQPVNDTFFAFKA